MKNRSTVGYVGILAGSAILSGCSIVLPTIIFGPVPAQAPVPAPEASVEVPADYDGAQPILVPATTVVPATAPVNPCVEHPVERTEADCDHVVAVPAPEPTTSTRPPLAVDRLPVQPAVEEPTTTTTIETRLVDGKERLPNACVLVTRQDADGVIRTIYLDGRQLPCDPINFDPFAYLKDFGPWGAK